MAESDGELKGSLNNFARKTAGDALGHMMVLDYTGEELRTNGRWSTMASREVDTQVGVRINYDGAEVIIKRRPTIQVVVTAGTAALRSVWAVGRRLEPFTPTFAAEAIGSGDPITSQIMFVQPHRGSLVELDGEVDAMSALESAARRRPDAMAMLEWDEDSPAFLSTATRGLLWMRKRERLLPNADSGSFFVPSRLIHYMESADLAQKNPQSEGGTEDLLRQDLVDAIVSDVKHR